MKHSLDIAITLNAWHTFLGTIGPWQHLIQHRDPLNGPNGLVYELPNYLQRPNESFAIVDMSAIAYSEPHYHPETEIYYILEGSGSVIIGNKEFHAARGDTIIIPSCIAHYVMPHSACVIAIVNTPPFNPNNYTALTETNNAVHYDHQDFLLKIRQRIL